MQYIRKQLLEGQDYLEANNGVWSQQVLGQLGKPGSVTITERDKPQTHLLVLLKLMCAAHIHIEGSFVQFGSQLVSCSLIVDAPCVQGARRGMVRSARHILKADKACLEQPVQQLLGILYASPPPHEPAETHKHTCTPS